MSETAKDGAKKKKGLFSFLGKKKNARPNAAPQAQEPPAEELTDNADGAPAEETQAQPVDTVLSAAGSQVYQAYCRINGVPPQPEDAVFDAAMFHMAGLAPTEETLGVLKSLDKNTAAMMERWTKAEAEAVAAEPVLFVSRDKMRVYLFVFPPMFGGEEVSEAQLAALLEREKITFGLGAQVIEAAGEGRAYMRILLVAAGVFPLDGLPGRVVDHFARGNEITLTVREDNTIDYRDLGWLQTVHQGDVICDIIAPTKAVNGFDVHGRELRGKDGRPAAVPNGTNTRINPEGTAVESAIDGVLTFASERFRVDPLLIVEGNLDIAVGNLDVVGDVLIKGDVQEGFHLAASGNITVNGGVEGATLKAGGNVQIGLGMNGNSIGSIDAGGDVFSKFFENTKVWALGSIVCDTIINSDIASEKEVLVRTGRGAIIGGEITALTRIAAVTMGNASNRAMEITLGNTNKYLVEKRGLEDAKLQESVTIEAITKDIRFLERQTDTPVKKEKLGELNLQLKMRRLKLSKLDREYQTMLLREADIAKCRLQAEVLYPPATITVGATIKSIRKNYYNVLVYYKDGEIHIGNV